LFQFAGCNNAVNNRNINLIPVAEKQKLVSKIKNTGTNKTCDNNYIADPINIEIRNKPLLTAAYKCKKATICGSLSA